MQTRTFLALAMLVCALAGFPAHAQQQDTVLRLLQPVTGEITSTQSEQRWTFDALKGQRLSIRMQATSGNLEPYMDLLDAAGTILATGRNASYRNVTIDALTIPDAATYTLRATRATPSSGEPTTGGYSLSLLPGFSFLLIHDPSGADAPLRSWRQQNASAMFDRGKLRLQMTAESAYTWTTAEKLGVFRDLYFQADMHPEQASGYWEGGILFRAAKRDNALEFYAFFLNSDGNWKLAYGQRTGLTTIQDWTALPDPLQDDMTVGAMAKEHQITLFYNGKPLTEVSDQTLNQAGVFGVAIGTGKAPNISTSILFSNIVVTLPTDESTDIPVSIPPKLAQWKETALPILEELQAAHLIPSSGRPGLDVSDAFVTNNTAKGIVYHPLGKSLSFTDLVYTADIVWDSNNENVACAMEFRVADDKNFTIVYIDRKGGFGIRQEGDKDGVIVSLYNLSDAIKKENRATNRVTIIAIGNGLIVYINGDLAISINAKQASGTTYIAAYNYEQASNVCQFNHVWLRAFDH